MPVGSVIAGLSNEFARNREYGVSNAAEGCHKDPSSYRFPLCLDSVSGYVRTTSAFKAIPGGTIKATFAVPTMNNKTFQRNLVVKIICPFESTQNFYRYLIKSELGYWDKFRCLNVTYVLARNTNVGLSPSIYTYNFRRKQSYYDSFMLEIDMNKFAPYYFNNSDIVMVNFRSFSSYYSNPNVSVKIIQRSLMFSAKAKSKDNILRVPIDEAFKFNIEGINVTFQVFGHSDLIKHSWNSSMLLVRYIPFVEGAVKLVILSRSSGKCSKNQCQEPSKKETNWSDSSEACLTIERLFSACHGKFKIYNACYC